MSLFKNMNKDKWLYGGLIVTFLILYAATAFVSFYHAITFFNIANAVWLSVLLSFVAEIGQASVLFSILLTENKNKFLPWIIMIILTTLQVIGNVVSSYDWIINHNGSGVQSFQKSILFWVQTENNEMFQVIIAWISGALLPIIALSMTSLVAQNMGLRAARAKTVLDVDQPEELKPTITPEQLEKINKYLSQAEPKTKEEVIDEIKKSEENVPSHGKDMKDNEQIARMRELMKDKNVKPTGLIPDSLKEQLAPGVPKSDKDDIDIQNIPTSIDQAWDKITDQDRKEWEKVLDKMNKPEFLPDGNETDLLQSILDKEVESYLYEEKNIEPQKPIVSHENGLATGVIIPESSPEPVEESKPTTPTADEAKKVEEDRLRRIRELNIKKK